MGVHPWYVKRPLKAVTEFSTAETYDTNVCGVPPFITQRKTLPSFTQYALSVTAFTQRNLLQLTDRTFTHKLIRLLPQVLSIHIIHNYFYAQIRLPPQILSIHIIQNYFHAHRRLLPQFLSTHIIQNCLQLTDRTFMHKLIRLPPQIISIHIIQNYLQQTDRTLTHKLIRHKDSLLKFFPATSYRITFNVLCTSKTPSSKSFHPHHTEFLLGTNKTPSSNSFHPHTTPTHSTAASKSKWRVEEQR